MSSGGTWQPPEQAGTPAPPPHAAPGAGRGGATPPPPPGGEPPEATVEEARPPTGRSRGAVIAAAVGAVALVGAAIFGITRLTGGDSDGGADSPEEAGLAVLTAFENEDVLGAIDVLLPGERKTFEDPASDFVAEMRRLEVLSSDADLSDVGGIDVVLENESVKTAATNVGDIVNLEISATGSVTVDGEALPIGDLVLDNVDAEPSELDVSAEETESDDFAIPMTAVEEDGRWYVSLFHTAAETIRAEAEEPVDIPAEGIAAAGGDSPEDAFDAFLSGIENLDLGALIASLNPDEFQALQRYAPAFLTDAQRSLDEAVSESDVSIDIADPEYTVSGDGDTRELSIDYFRVDVSGAADTGETQKVSFEFSNGCFTVEGAEEPFNSCDLAGDAPALDELFDDPEPVQNLLDTVQEAFSDYENPGFVVKEVDGQWYLSPLATGSEQMLSVLRALDREEMEQLSEDATEAFEDAFEEMSGSDIPVIGQDQDAEAATTVPTEGTVAPPTESTLPGNGSVPTSVDAAGVCYSETSGEAAGACFQELIDAGDIDPATVPVYVRFPECGLAEVYWSGDYTDLPDAEFVSIVEEAAPCFQDLVKNGELDEADLPFELAYPECLDGRNWFTALDDDAYGDAVLDCAYG